MKGNGGNDEADYNWPDLNSMDVNQLRTELQEQR